MAKILALDIGIGTVGYALIDDIEAEILEAGTRIFQSADASNNLIRRTMRGTRRLKRRRIHRLDRVRELLENYKLDDFEKLHVNMNPYEIRVRGLSQKITKSELNKALLHIVKRRGISYLDDLDEDVVNKGNLGEVSKTLNNMHVCEMQLDALNKYYITKNKEDKVRGITNALITTSAYEKEVRKILDTQRQFYKEISDEFIEEFIGILKGKREYFIGPGNEKSRTDYGVYRTNGETLENLFEILIGKCTVYDDEYRAPRNSYTAQEFNVLNDLNNIKVDNMKLSKDEKIEIITKVLQSKTVNMMKIISKVTKKDESLISGFRVNKDGKPEFHKFETYRYVMGQLKSTGEDLSIITVDKFDEIATILTLETQKSRKKIKLYEKVPELGEEIIEKLSDIKNNYFDGWHSLSIKVMKEIRNELYDTDKNQMQIFSESNMLNRNRELYKYRKNVPVGKNIDSEVLSPIAKRSIRQSLNIVNRIRKLYGDIDHIVIEMAREVTTDSKQIEKEQKNNEKEKLKSIDEALSQYRFDANKISVRQKEKIRLWHQQEGNCIYSGNTIRISDLLFNDEMFDIDHIIPRSISFDNSLNNKVICYSEINRSKQNLTPHRYILRNPKYSYEDFKTRVLDLYKKNKITAKKKDLLLFEEDIQKIDVVRGFINRNLVDTRYATKVVLNILQDYAKANDKKMKIHTVKGSFTSNLRKEWGIKKNRQLYKNHAEDAIIIASTKMIKFGGDKNLFNTIEEYKNYEGFRIDEVYSEEEYSKSVYSLPIKNLPAKIKDFNYKYSHKVDKKINRQITDQTIYSTREVNGEDYIIEKYKDIYGDDGAKLRERILNKPETLLMYNNDTKTFELLKKIIEEYPNDKNPFLKYKEEYKEDIRKYSKKNNGPAIRQVKFKSTRLGAHVDITHKYVDTEKTQNGKKIISLSLKPLRVDIYEKDGQYKFAAVYYKTFKFKVGKYVLDMDKYNEELINKQIDDSFRFKFTLYKNDRFNMVYNGIEEAWIFTSIYNNRENKIECKHIDRKADKGEKRVSRSIGKNSTNMIKIATDILGNEYEVKEEKLILEF